MNAADHHANQLDNDDDNDNVSSDNEENNNESSSHMFFSSDSEDEAVPPLPSAHDFNSALENNANQESATRTVS